MIISYKSQSEPGAYNCSGTDWLLYDQLFYFLVYFRLFRSPLSINKPVSTMCFKKRLVVESANPKISRASLLMIKPCLSI